MSQPLLQPLSALYPERQPRLLLVDDQPLYIRALYEIFRDDCEVYMATSGQQALDLCARNRPDLVLLDLVMPGMGGIEVCRRLKQDRDLADTPVLFVTAQDDVESETQALEAGGLDYIAKPVNPAVVRARVRTHLTLKAQADQLRKVAYRDGLTGVANRRYFDEHLQSEWSRCARLGTPLALLLLDIDCFKRFNDHYGHIAGDECLQAVGCVLCKLPKRGHDFCARYGGEEFVCLLTDCDLPNAVDKAMALHGAIRALNRPHAASPIAEVVTVSIGVAALIPDLEVSPSVLLEQADTHLYEAKHGGRDRVFPSVENAAEVTPHSAPAS